jgi:hypothetical protein
MVKGFDYGDGVVGVKSRCGYLMKCEGVLIFRSCSRLIVLGLASGRGELTGKERWAGTGTAGDSVYF